MAVLTGHPDAVRELRPEPRARFFFAGKCRQADVFVAGIFGETPKVGIKGFCRVHAAEWGRTGFEGLEGAGRR